MCTFCALEREPDQIFRLSVPSYHGRTYQIVHILKSSTHKKVPICVVPFLLLFHFRIHDIHFCVTWVMCIYDSPSSFPHWYKMIWEREEERNRDKGRSVVRCCWYHTLTCCHMNNISHRLSSIVQRDIKMRTKCARDIVYTLYNTQDIHTMDFQLKYLWVVVYLSRSTEVHFKENATWIDLKRTSYYDCTTNCICIIECLIRPGRRWRGKKDLILHNLIWLNHYSEALSNARAHMHAKIQY